MAVCMFQESALTITIIVDIAAILAVIKKGGVNLPLQRLSLIHI